MQKVGRDLRPGEKPIIVGFVGFHELFNPIFNHVTLSLASEFPLFVTEVSKGEVPDFLFFSVFGSPHRAPCYDRCVKIFTCEENIRPPWGECDFAFTGDRLNDPRHLRYPIYARYLYHLKDHTGRTLVKHANYNPAAILKSKTRFCNFVYSNGGARERIMFFEMLSKYKHVDSGGGVLNNMGRKVGDKLAFLENYKFTIAFENSQYPGYVSEKLAEPMVANSIPIYWGDPNIHFDFNPHSFVCADESENLETQFRRIIGHIVYLDNHDDAYLRVLTEPWFYDNQPNKYCQPDYLFDFARTIFNSKPPITRSLARSSTTAQLHVDGLLVKPNGWCWADHLSPRGKE